MTFARRGTKDAALRALARLDAVLADPRVVALERAVREREWLLDPASHDPEQLWRDYAADAASFHALLSTLGGVGVADDQDAAGGFVPAELRQQITAIPLDTSLLRATLRGYQVFGAQYSLHQQRSVTRWASVRQSRRWPCLLTSRRRGNAGSSSCARPAC
jgi:hypothetical protein